MGVLESCKNLGTWPDIYFVHQADPDHEEEIFGKGGALDALCQLKEEGRIRFIGVASHYYDILLRGAGDRRVDVLQGSGNLLERGMLERIKKEPLFRVPIYNCILSLLRKGQHLHSSSASASICAIFSSVKAERICTVFSV